MKIAQTTPELAVPDVKAAQAYYRDRMGFDVAWYNEAGQIGAVSHGECAIFLRAAEPPCRTGVFWIFTENVDVAFKELTRLGANITDPVRDTPWGMRQFTVEDLVGNVFYFHHDIDNATA
jgi:uncharacterized glyoxalase superfamily protein PhnB